MRTWRRLEGIVKSRLDFSRTELKLELDERRDDHQMAGAGLISLTILGTIAYGYFKWLITQ